MNKKLDKIIIIDIEATCWENEPPEGEESEIIEIGVALLDVQTLTISDNESIIVKPIKSLISPFCTKLTSITEDMVNSGISFAEACEILKNKYKSHRRTWASWGDYDRKQFEKQCRAWCVPIPFGSTHINIKNLFSIFYNYPKEFGLNKAAQLIGLTMEGTLHRGVDDAMNISRAFAKLLYQCRCKGDNFGSA